VQETAPLTHILLATGSELQLAIAAAKTLGAGTRVISMPSFERFNASRQNTAMHSASVCRKRVRSKPE